jgi:5-methylcytosine-specific restriction endonuclease McrA
MTAEFERLWEAQSGRCALCGEPMPKGRFDVPHATVWKKKRPTFDHIRPRLKGGTDDRANLQLAHAECNWRKGSDWKPPKPAPRP